MPRRASAQCGDMLTGAAATLLWLSDADDALLYLSDRAPHLIEAGAAQSLALHIPCIHPQDRVRVLAMYRSAKRKHAQFHAEYRILDRNGVLRWISASGAPRFSASGDFIGYIGALVDVSDRHAALEESREREERLRSLTTLSSDWYWETDEQGRFIYRSDRESLPTPTGLSPAAIIGMSRHELAFDPQEPAFLAYLDALAQCQPFRNLRYATKAPTPGVKRYASISGEPVFKDGSFIGYRGIGRDVTRYMETRQRLIELAEENKALVDNSVDINSLLDRAGRFLRLNAAVQDILGYGPEELLGTHYAELVHPEDRGRLRDVELRLRGGEGIVKDLECRCLRKDGAVIHLSLSIRWSQGKQLSYASARDVSERYRAREQLQKSKDELHSMLESIGDAFYAIDRNWRITYANRKAAAFIGMEPERMIGSMVLDLVPELAASPAFAHYRRAMQTRQQSFFETYWKPSAAWLEVRIYPNDDGLSVYLHDITARKEAEQRLEQLATHDTLTGLPNRALLHQRLQQMLELSPRDASIAVLFIDLDGFKGVNDSLGHKAGDTLLREVATRLSAALRPSDVVARMGGDEFVVAAHCSSRRGSAAAISEKLLQTLALPLELDAQEVFIGASIGISMYPEDGNSNELLLQNADTAMYRAKAAGRNRYCFFEPEMSAAAKTRMLLESALRRAQGRGEFAVHYQPRLNLKTMSIVGMEALLRWKHPELGQVPPAQFIPLAEEGHLINAIGNWVLGQACRDTVALMKEFGQPLKVSVNLSARQLRNGKLIDEVRAALADNNFPPQLLELELTESALIEDIEHSVQILKQLKELGVKLAVDDFGTGYSGLAYLRRFPLDAVKLDRSFLLQKDEGGGNFDFIKAFVDMSHALKLSVVAEGVETAETLQFVGSAACDEAQGYFIAQPMPPAQLGEHLREHLGAGLRKRSR
jgi:diguanylate cyclase (GGDEF)-like protein/PAS domain S-box-containing protein